MKIFKCHNRVSATPMNRLDYNVYRGWTLPEDENGSDAGYLVEYLDGGEQNHPSHNGYISWSPKDQFDRGYGEVLEAESRVKADHVKLMVDSLIFEYAKIGTKTTVCLASLPCGFSVSSGSSACVDPKNFDYDMGCEIAKKNALIAATNKLWELEGYLLKVTGKTSDKH